MVLKFKNFNNLKYVGGLSQIKNIKDPIKLSANESALGPSKKPSMHLLKVVNNYIGTQMEIQIF